MNTINDLSVSNRKFTEGWLKNRKNLYGSISENIIGGIDVKHLVHNLDKAMRDSLPIDVPETTIYITMYSDSVSVLIKNKVNAEKTFKYGITAYSNNADTVLQEFFYDVYKELLEDTLIEENLVQVNRVISELASMSALPFEVRVVSPIAGEGKVIPYISDELVLFSSTKDGVFSLEDNLLFREDTEGNPTLEGLVKQSKIYASNQLAYAQTPEQLVFIGGGDLLKTICGIQSRVKPFTYIKQVSTRNAEKILSKKPVLAYVKDGEIFSLVEASRDSARVVLSPFNVETFRRVENYDVLEKLSH